MFFEAYADAIMSKEYEFAYDCWLPNKRTETWHSLQKFELEQMFVTIHDDVNIWDVSIDLDSTFIRLKCKIFFTESKSIFLHSSMKKLLESRTRDIPELAVELKVLLDNDNFSYTSLYDLHNPETYRLLNLNTFENDLASIRLAFDHQQIHSIPRLYNLFACKINGNWFFENFEPINTNRFGIMGYRWVDVEAKINTIYLDRKK